MWNPSRGERNRENANTYIAVTFIMLKQFSLYTSKLYINFPSLFINCSNLVESYVYPCNMECILSYQDVYELS